VLSTLATQRVSDAETATEHAPDLEPQMEPEDASERRSAGLTGVL
jgi:hypothetical protein